MLKRSIVIMHIKVKILYFLMLSLCIIKCQLRVDYGCMHVLEDVSTSDPV